ncbi:LAME_0B05138g1_1 [Lachancea meyersii CBS 8951]|uniref:LAME_0B05138g1_1 n=1 Tax=Lachancea meyersii CBS 8951 TaxID=1266667 RepID=A0A1G4IVW6_9SACH|nr:LAME_0B05138g1_1 [Lachancea meyersii CBS 8951]
MSFLTPPNSVAGLNKGSGAQNFVLDTPGSQLMPMEGPDMSLKKKNNICKSFEDDVFFCPRGLLSTQEQSTCQQMDLFLLDQMREIGNARIQGPKHLENMNMNMSMNMNMQMQPQLKKFNPYTSQSFSPAPPPFEHQTHIQDSNNL